MFEVIVSLLARQDINNIYDYIEYDLAAPVAADRFEDNIIKCLGNLEDNPMMYEMIRDEQLAESGFRRAVVQNYVLVYKADEERKIVRVYRVFHGSQDYEKLL